MLKWAVIGRFRNEPGWYVLTRFADRTRAEIYVKALSEHTAMVIDSDTEQVALMMLRDKHDEETISNYCPF